MARKKNPILLAILLLFATPLLCQTSSDAVTLGGVVSETKLLPHNALHVWLQDGQSSHEVCLGSMTFLQAQSLVPQVGDRIEVTGTRAVGGSLLVASSLQMGGKNLGLRGANSDFVRAGCEGGGCGYGCGYGECAGCGDHGNHPYGHCCGHE